MHAISRYCQTAEFSAASAHMGGQVSHLHPGVLPPYSRFKYGDLGVRGAKI